MNLNGALWKVAALTALTAIITAASRSGSPWPWIILGILFIGAAYYAFLKWAGCPPSSGDPS
jgi:hypothetical protein